jgi:hypothetical protein
MYLRICILFRTNLEGNPCLAKFHLRPVIERNLLITALALEALTNILKNGAQLITIRAKMHDTEPLPSTSHTYNLPS